jgi:hypothetical protein
MPLEDIGRYWKVDGFFRPMALYWTGVGWSDTEAAAAPIIAIDETMCRNERTRADPQWCYSEKNDGDCGEDKARLNAFGELSVKLIRDEQNPQSIPFLVMLSNHRKSPVLFRTARLVRPDKWSEPEQTDIKGYGPYILDGAISAKNEKLELYYVISTWDGVGGESPYGVYTTPLKLAEKSGSAPPTWPPKNRESSALSHSAHR